MAFFNPNIKLSVPNNKINLACDALGNLSISGSNASMNVNLLSTGTFEINGAPLPTPEDITTLTDEVNQINQNLLTAGLGVFSSQPIQIALIDGDTPPTNKAYLTCLNGSSLIVNSDDNSGFGGIGMKDATTLNIDSCNGSGIINLTGSELQFNGVPVGNVALDECFSTPVQGTFTTAPIEITSVDAQTANMTLVKGGTLIVQSPDTASQGELSCDNGGSLNFQGLISKVSQAVEHEMVKGAQTTYLNSSNSSICSVSNLDNNLTLSSESGQVDILGSALTFNGSPVGGGNVALDECFSVPVSSTFTTQPISITSIDDTSCDLELLKGGSLSFQSPDTASSGLINISDTNVMSVSGMSQLKIQNSSLNVNTGSRNVVIAVEDLYGTCSIVGAGTYTFDSSIIVNGGDGFQIARAGNYCKIRPDGGIAVFLTDASSYSFDKDVYSNSRLLQPVQSGDTASRPVGVPVGFMYFDTSLSPKPHAVWYTGTGSTGWVDYNGDDN